MMSATILMKKSSERGGYVRVPANDHVSCPKCQAENIGRKVHVWSVADERGHHYECEVCAHDWTTPYRS